MYGFELMTGGNYYGATPGSGSSTGTHPDLILFEDPQTREQAENVLDRTALAEWYWETMPSRGIGKDAVHVVSQQRLSMLDLSGTIVDKYKQELKEEGKTDWVHISLPMRYSPDLAPSPVAPFADWRTKKGELLFPEFMNEQRTKKLERSLSRKSKWAVETQMQQNVLSKGGAVFNVARLRFIDELNPLPTKFDKIVRFWDRAATPKEEDADACYTAGVAIGMVGDDKFYVLNVKRDQWNSTDVENEMGATMAQDVSRWGWSTVMTAFEQEPGSAGKQVAEMTCKKFRQYQIYAVRPTQNKGVRAQPLGAAIERYEVWVDPTEPWYLDWVTELQSFSVLDGGYKDQADASGGAYNELVLPSEDVGKFYTPPSAKDEAANFPAYGSNVPCISEGCRRPAFAGAATGGYCCQCCADDKAHTTRCNGEYTDWFVTARNSL